jgi:hypothetical protein
LKRSKEIVVLLLHLLLKAVHVGLQLHVPLLRLKLVCVCSQEVVNTRPYHLPGALKEHVVARIRLAPIEANFLVGVVGLHERRCLGFAHVQGVFQVRNSDALHN